MGTSRLGPWIAGALVAACVVMAGLIVFGGGDAPKSRTPSPAETPRAPAARGVAPLPRAVQRAAQAAAAAAEPPGTVGFVAVRVTASEDGSPIAGAAVVVPDVDDDRARRVTGADGCARFGPFVAHDWPLRASADGRLPRSATVLVEGGGEAELGITLDPATTLSVRVEDGAGEVIAKASVSAEPLGGGYRNDARTQSDGVAALAMPVGSIVRVVAKVEGFGDAVCVVRTPPRGASPLSVTLRLTPPGRLVGTVRDASGKPVPGAVVVLRPSSEALTSAAILGIVPAEFRHGGFATADADGRFVAGPLVAGLNYHAIASTRPDDRPGASSDVAEDIRLAAAGGDVTRDFTVQPPGTIVVTVTNPDGTIATDARVTTGSARILSRGTIRAVEGLVTFERRPAEHRELRVSTADPVDVVAVAPHGRSASRRVSVPAGATLEVSLELAPSPEVSGTVVDDLGRPVAGARVGVGTDDDAAQQQSISMAVSGEDGAWRVASWRRGAGRLRASAPGHSSVVAATVTVPSEGNRLVLTRTASVTFRLVPPGDAPRPMSPSVRIGAAVQSPNIDQATGVARVDFDASEGDRISIVFAPRNNGRLPQKPTPEDFETAYAEYAPIVRTLRPVPGEVEDLGDIALVRPSMLRARVVDPAGRAVAGAKVRTDVETVWLRFGISPPVTDSQGAFEFRCAPATGSVPLVVSAAGFLHRRVEVSTGGSDLPTITLFRGGLLWGEVVDATGAPVPDAPVRVTDANNATQSVVADASGVFGVRVEAGRWLVCSNGGIAESAQASEGGETHVRLVAGGR